MSAAGLREGAADLRLVARGWRWGRRPLVPRSAEPFVPAPAKRPFDTAWARTPAVGLLREGVQRFGLMPLLRREVQIRVTGLDVLSRVTAPVLFVANHSSHLDTPLVLCSLPTEWRRCTAVAAAADYFFDTWWRAVGSAVAFGTFPIERHGGLPSTAPGELLAQGWNVLIFPEGTRSTDGWVQRLRPGAANLAAEHGVPVVPIALRGSFAAMPRGRRWPAKGRPPISVRFGDPVLVEPGDQGRDVAPRLTAALARLFDEDATTWWEALQRASIGATPPASGPSAAVWRRVWSATESPRRPSRRRTVWEP
jgi:1-acyl-sn-glycerol-3-phosphate acyltransferase